MALDRLWDLLLPPGRLDALAGEIGSDVAFFRHAPAAVCRGRAGEVAEQAAALGDVEKAEAGLLDRSDNPWKFPGDIRELILTPMRAVKVSVPVLCSHPLIDAVYMPHAEGVLIPLVLRDRIAAGLYADRSDRLPAVEALQILCYTAAQAIELLPFRERASTATLPRKPSATLAASASIQAIRSAPFQVGLKRMFSRALARAGMTLWVGLPTSRSVTSRLEGWNSG